METSDFHTVQSLPVRERGLKYYELNRKLMMLRVAPRAGAWIEICTCCKSSPKISVAPRAGAWIEISVRGAGEKSDKVAPRAGAWIEMIISNWVDKPKKSLPVRERGLKSSSVLPLHANAGRSPCGSVD